MAGPDGFKLVLQVAPMYERFSLHDGEREPKEFPYRVPLAVLLNCSFQGSQAEGIDLCFLIDRSSSMKESPGPGWGDVPSRAAAVAATLRQLAPALGPNDRVGLVAFDHECQAVAPELRPAAELAELVGRLPEPRGATDIAAALEAGVQALQGRGERPAAVVLLTDGEAYVPTAKTREEKAQTAAADRQRARDQAIERIGLLEDAGLDFIALGFGDKWDEQLLNALAGRVGQHGVRHIDTPDRALAAFREAARLQQESVVSQVRVEGELNTQWFRWEKVWSVLPGRSVGRDIDIKGQAKLGASRGGRWYHTLGNVLSSEKAGYSLVVTARPLPGLPAGEHIVARFRLLRRNQPASDWHPVKLHVISNPILQGSTSDPQHPAHLVKQAWLLGLAADAEVVRNEHVKANRPADAQKEWEKILKLHELAQNLDELETEREEFDAYCRSHALSPAEMKRKNERMTSTSAPVSRRAHEQLLTQAEGARGYLVQMTPDGTVSFTESTHSIVPRVPRRLKGGR
jgi:hypothetical protein